MKILENLFLYDLFYDLPMKIHIKNFNFSKISTSHRFSLFSIIFCFCPFFSNYKNSIIFPLHVLSMAVIILVDICFMGERSLKAERVQRVRWKAAARKSVSVFLPLISPHYFPISLISPRTTRYFVEKRVNFCVGCFNFIKNRKIYLIMQIFAPDFFRLTYFRRLKMQLSCISNRFIFIFLASAKIRKILFSVRRFLGPRNFVFYGFADKHFMTITLSFQALPGPWVCSGK